MAMLGALLVALVTLLPGAASASFESTVVDVTSSRGVMQRFLYLKPAQPVANAMVLTGGPGILSIQDSGTIGQPVQLAALRLANVLASQGIAVALVDAPSDRVSGPGLSDFRQRPEHLADLMAVQTYLQQHASVPLWVVGWSFGTISATYFASNLPQGQPLGLVLLVPPTAISDQVPGGANLLDIDLSGLKRPMLYLYHPSDQCPTSPPANVPLLVARLSGATVLEVFSFIGGSAPNPYGTCPTGSYHSFNDLETEVGAAIGAWISAHNSLLGGSPSTLALAVEYYHAAFDHYFISASLPDIRDLGSGRFTGWTPTGATIGVYAQSVPGANPVCRFYIPPAYGNSHFYSASPDECAQTQSKFPFFDYEGANVFYIGLPNTTTGACPPGTSPVYRVWNNRADSNHRYTMSQSVRDQMVARGGIAEGYGPANVIMCSPA